MRLAEATQDANRQHLLQFKCLGAGAESLLLKGSCGTCFGALDFTLDGPLWAENSCLALVLVLIKERPAARAMLPLTFFIMPFMAISELLAYAAPVFLCVV